MIKYSFFTVNYNLLFKYLKFVTARQFKPYIICCYMLTTWYNTSIFANKLVNNMNLQLLIASALER